MKATSAMTEISWSHAWDRHQISDDVSR